MVNFFCDVAAIFFSPVMQAVPLQVAEPLWHRKSWPHIGIKPGRRGLATGGRSGTPVGPQGGPGPQAFPSKGVWIHPFLQLGSVRGFQV